MAEECEKIKIVCSKLQHNLEPSEVVVKFISGKTEGVWLSMQKHKVHPSIVSGIQQDLFHTKIFTGLAKSSTKLKPPDFSNYVLLDKQCFK